MYFLCHLISHILQSYYKLVLMFLWEILQAMIAVLENSQKERQKSYQVKSCPYFLASVGKYMRG